MEPIPEGDPGSSSFPVHGSVTTTLRERWASSASDLDARSLVRLDLGDPAKHRWTGHLTARVSGDLDGRSDRNSPFYGLDDTEDGSIVSRLYDAYAETRGPGGIARARIGRQTLWDTPVLAWFDGASAETKEWGKAKLYFGAYGGVPVHLYEDSRGGDLLGGAYGQVRPWHGSRLRFDWMRLEDEGTFGDHAESLWKASGWQSLGASVRLDATASRLGEDPRDWSVGTTWYEPDADLTVRASYFELLQTQRDLPPELDPFFATLHDFHPYRQARLLASKGFGSKLNVQAGADVRRVSEDEDAGLFNRDFERYFTTWQIQDVLPAKLVLALTGEVWDGDGSDIRTWGVDLSRRFGESVDASAGSYYSLYKTDLFASTEREDVRTWFGRLRWKRTKGSSFDLRYELEDQDPETLQSLRVGWTWRF